MFFGVRRYGKVFRLPKEVISISSRKTTSRTYELTDTQGEAPSEGFEALDKVGIRDLRMPLLIKVREGGSQQVTASVDVGVNVPGTQRGAHLSRFIELIEDYRESSFHIDSVSELVRRTRDRLEATNAFVEVEFAYFMEKQSPLSEKRGMMDFDCGFGGMLRDGELVNWIMAEVPITTLCPCSKRNSNSGAHNQRALVTTKVAIDERVWLEELIEMVEAEGSSQLYSLLKREDEAYVTDEAYDNPKFVEDVVRDLGRKIKDHEKMGDFYIDCNSFESIHNHDAYAQMIEGDIWQGRYLV